VWWHGKQQRKGGCDRTINDHHRAWHVSIPAEAAFSAGRLAHCARNAPEDQLSHLLIAFGEWGGDDGRMSANGVDFVTATFD
jgi:hypothetical protein